MSKEQLEREFVFLLSRLQPDRDTVREFPKIAAKLWTKKQGDTEARSKKLVAQLKDQKQLKAELLKAKLRGEVSQADYEQANAEFSDEIAAIEGELQLIESSRATLESFVRFAELMLVDISGAWEKAGPEQRVRVQNLLFNDGFTRRKWAF